MKQKIAIVFLALFWSAIVGASPLALNEKWLFYEAPFPTWEEVDVADLSKLSKAKAESVSLPGGVFLRETKDGGVSLLVNRFDAASDGMIYLRCGVSCSYMQVGFNGKMVLDVRTAFPRTAEGGNGSHVIPLPVKKGHNALSVKFFGTKYGFADGKCRFYFAFSSADKAEYQNELPTRENLAKIHAGTPKLLVVERIIRNGVDEMIATDFAKFERPHNFSAADLEKCYRHYPILEFYDRAFDKVLREIPQTRVTHGIVVWHVYNMGYVIKTPACCFGIDIHHRRAAELAPLLDFVLVTHNHEDHYNLQLLGAMAKAKKSVISNFYPAKGYQRPPSHFEFADVAVTSEETDHNATLKKFISVYRIQCGRGDDAPVIYHSGDSCDAHQLHPKGRIDIHILHPRVGLSVPEAAKLLRPREIWFSHLLEMGHCKPSIYRPVDWSSAYSDMEIMKAQGTDVSCRCPMWGEKIVIP